MANHTFYNYLSMNKYVFLKKLTLGAFVILRGLRPPVSLLSHSRWCGLTFFNLACKVNFRECKRSETGGLKPLKITKAPRVSFFKNPMFAGLAV